MKSRRGRVLLPLLLTLPALVFITANVLKYELGIGFLHDPLAFVLEPRSVAGNIALLAVLFLAPAIAAGLTLRRTARLSVRRAPAEVEANLTLRVGWGEAVSLLLSLGALATLGLYLVVENF